LNDDGLSDCPHDITFCDLFARDTSEHRSSKRATG
jgi:hypothetical protein